MPLKLPIYLDYHATTPVDPQVFEAMKPYFTEIFGNPASGTHSFGWKAEAAVQKAREQVAQLIHAADPKEIIWTSGTTESINLAMIGVAEKYRDKGNHLITCVTEHRSVLNTAKFLAQKGFEVTFLPVDSGGHINLDDLKKSIRPTTLLLSIMAANNEIGTLHPLAEIGRIAKEHGVLLHLDGAQACGKIPIDVEKMGIDLFSMSAHKSYGPKGVGALYIRKRSPAVQLAPLIQGGTHEEGIRPGTLAVPNIVGMGKAFEIAGAVMQTETTRLRQLRDRLCEGLHKMDGVLVNGDMTHRLPGNLNLSFLPLRSSDLMAKLRDIAVSSGSACTSGSLEPSYVIRALGVGDERARASIRFGLGRYTTEAEIDFVIQKMTEVVTELRATTYK